MIQAKHTKRVKMVKKEGEIEGKTAENSENWFIPLQSPQSHRKPSLPLLDSQTKRFSMKFDKISVNSFLMAKQLQFVHSLIHFDNTFWLINFTNSKSMPCPVDAKLPWITKPISCARSAIFRLFSAKHYSACLLYW